MKQRRSSALLAQPRLSFSPYGSCVQDDEEHGRSCLDGSDEAGAGDEVDCASGYGWSAITEMQQIIRVQVKFVATSWG
ncbi:hypothetical protein L484_005123 [Morus notabilis]|uniref:Uncharacterized protein n=1 Tax=Morus notabilis TaxID=981085 RepID=W9R6C3_9ROSA|nr:hypothetical protein L484_005123 [Morus notabilis]